MLSRKVIVGAVVAMMLGFVGAVWAAEHPAGAAKEAAPKEVTLTGKVIAAPQEEKGAAAMLQADITAGGKVSKQMYMVVDDEQGKALAKEVGKTVEVKGMVEMKGTVRWLTVKESKPGMEPAPK